MVVDIVLVVLDGDVNKTEQLANPDTTLPSRMPVSLKQPVKRAQDWVRGQPSGEYQVYQKQLKLLAQRS